MNRTLLLAMSAVILGAGLAAGIGYRVVSFVVSETKKAQETFRLKQEEADRRAASEQADRAFREEARKKEASHEATPEEQAEAKETVQELIQAGAFREVVVKNGVAEAIVTDSFMALDFKKKELAIVVVSSWAYKTPKGKYPTGLVILKHVKTGKKVGEFGPLGFSME